MVSIFLALSGLAIVGSLLGDDDTEATDATTDEIDDFNSEAVDGATLEGVFLLAPDEGTVSDTPNESSSVEVLLGNTSVEDSLICDIGFRGEVEGLGKIEFGSENYEISKDSNFTANNADGEDAAESNEHIRRGVDGQAMPQKLLENSFLLVEGVIESPISNDEEVFPVIYSAVSEGGIPPLDDWALSDDLEIVNLADVDEISLVTPDQLGSFRVVQADYYERVPSEDGIIVHNIHAGANIYFVSDGEQFPDQYQWSESSANLYDSESYTNQIEDFGNIKLILRVDTGFLHADNESEKAEEFKARAFREFQEFLSSGG